MIFIEQDILDIRYGIICQQVNMQGVMGAGLAKQIKQKWPVVFGLYQEKLRNPRTTLGDVDFVSVNAGITVASIFAQRGYGRGVRQTDYAALEMGLKAIAGFVRVPREQFPGYKIWDVYVPYGIGCGLGGGDWDVVSKLIEKYLPYAIVCKLPGKKDEQ